ncbi:MAG: GGDEF domain-containing protein [Moraxellaceae bacterium]|nr:GGDEF domain-containing protein [Moraxellaceae bacterium]
MTNTEKIALLLFKLIEKQQRTIKTIILVSLITLVGILDYFTGYELAFSLFYVIPVTFATWFFNHKIGILTAIISAIVWFLADIFAGQIYSHSLIYLWNTLIRFSFFLIISLLLSKLKTQIEHEQALARTDSLTGAINARCFYELAQLEIDRLERHNHIFTLAYIDLDHFKAVNDQHGHSAGDEALRLVTHTLQKHIRKIDILARLGGDEFALLLPVTSQSEAQAVFAKLQKALLREMQLKNWPITFSVGVVTCHRTPNHLKEIIEITDKLMYEVKKEGRNAIKYAIYD